jgi:hypothetical protein
MRAEEIKEVLLKVYPAQLEYPEEVRLDTIEYEIAKQLTHKQLLFCESLFKNGFDRRIAEAEAGYRYNGQSEATNRYIDYKVKKMLMSNKFDIIKNYEFLKNILNANILDYIQVETYEDKRGATHQKIICKDIESMPREMSLLIKKIEQDKYGNIIIELFDKMDALKTLEKYLGLEKGVVNVNNINIDNSVTNNYDNMTSDELIKLAVQEGYFKDEKEADLYAKFEDE